MRHDALDQRPGADEECCDQALAPEKQAGRLKKFLNFIGLAVDTEGRFLHEMRRTETLADLLKCCDAHLLGARATIARCRPVLSIEIEERRGRIEAQEREIGELRGTLARELQEAEIRRRDLERAIEIAKTKGVRRAMLLPVSAPFHCALMAPAADAMAALYGYGAVMVALRNVEVNGGRGQVMDLPLFDPLFSVLGPQAANHKLTGEVKVRTGSRSTNAAPRNVYQTKDGSWVCLSASTQGMAERVLVKIGHPELVKDPRFATNIERVRNGVELDHLGGFTFYPRKTMTSYISHSKTSCYLE